MSGSVFLVGAGPGNPGLLTRRGAELLARANVVFYDGLVNAALLDLAPACCERVYAGKKHSVLGPPMTQAAINALMVEHARAGRRVVRLKGGDPFVFGRAAEEARYLADAGVSFEVIPGVTSATAVPAYAGIPLTARGVASTVAFATGHEEAGKPSSVDWQGLARADTVVLFMALQTLEECTRQLLAAGRRPETPAAAVYWGTTADQRTVTATLATLPESVTEAGLKPPVLVIVGDVVALREPLDWYERRPLFGARILVTRRIEQSHEFACAAAELGAQTVCAPVTRLLPPASRSAIGKAINRLDTFEWVVFTSANAVERFFDELDSRNLDSRALGLARVACVGPATAAELATRGIRADVVPAHGDAEALAAGIVGRSGKQLVGAQILIPRSAQGRDAHIAVLRAAGAEVQALSVYRTEAAPADEPSVAHGLRELREGRVQALAAFAPSQVTALFELLGDDAAALINRCRVVAAIGHTTGRALTDRGVRVDLVPSSPRAEVLARELATAYKER